MRLFIKLGLVALGMTSLAFSSNADIIEKQNELIAKIDSVKAKEGIEFGGQFKGEFFRSTIDGNAAIDGLRKTEDVTYTEVDFDIKARPNTSTTAHVIMRMHADWPIFWGSLNNPISVRWISLDGKIGDFTWYHIGDFKAKWSEYSIWSDNRDLLNSAYIFEEMQNQARSEAFLGENFRPFQGVNLKGAVKIGPLDYLGLEAIGARLRTAFMPKLASNSPDKLPQSMVLSSFEAAEKDKYLIGAKTDMEIKGLDVGLSYLTTMDSKLSSKYGKTTPLTTSNFDVDLRIDVAKIIGKEELTLVPKIEYAMSNYSVEFDGDTILPENYQGDVDDNAGTGMLAGAELGYSAGKSFNGVIDFGFVNNSANYRNDLAQSPEFIPTKIMNTDNNPEGIVTKDTSTFGASYNYSTYFDSRYHHVYKSVTKVQTDRGVEYLGYPTSKISYTNMVITAEESGIFAPVMSASAAGGVSTPFAFGTATPNRTGIKLGLDAAVLDAAIDLNGYFYSIKEAEEYAFYEYAYEKNEDGDNTGVSVKKIETKLPVASFTNIGFGTDIHIGSIAKLSRIIDLNIAFENGTVVRDGSAEAFGVDLNSTMLGAGIYVNLISKLSLLGGYQMMNAEDKKWNIDQEDTHLMFGLEYKINNGAYLLASMGKIDHKDNAVDDGQANFSQNLISTKIKVNF